jgi:transcriptional regulator with XRE-family HTH domain
VSVDPSGAAPDIGPGSDDVDVGPRLRDRRQRLRMTLREVATQAGLSESFLSQVERGRANISLSALKRVAGALDCSIGDLFADSFGAPYLLRKDQRPRLDIAGGKKFLLTPRPFVDLESFVIEFDPSGSTGDEQYTHADSEELVVVLEGSVVAYVGNHTYALGAGDSLRYRSSTPHRVVCSPDRPAQVLWVMSPPSF